MAILQFADLLPIIHNLVSNTKTRQSRNQIFTAWFAQQVLGDQIALAQIVFNVFNGAAQSDQTISVRAQKRVVDNGADYTNEEDETVEAVVDNNDDDDDDTVCGIRLPTLVELKSLSKVVLLSYVPTTSGAPQQQQQQPHIVQSCGICAKEYEFWYNAIAADYKLPSTLLWTIAKCCDTSQSLLKGEKRNYGGKTKQQQQQPPPQQLTLGGDLSQRIRQYHRSEAFTATQYSLPRLVLSDVTQTIPPISTLQGFVLRAAPQLYGSNCFRNALQQRELTITDILAVYAIKLKLGLTRKLLETVLVGPAQKSCYEIPRRLLTSAQFISQYWQYFDAGLRSPLASISGGRHTERPTLEPIVKLLNHGHRPNGKQYDRNSKSTEWTNEASLLKWLARDQALLRGEAGDESQPAPHTSRYIGQPYYESAVRILLCYDTTVASTIDLDGTDGVNTKGVRAYTSDGVELKNVMIKCPIVYTAMLMFKHLFANALSNNVSQNSNFKHLTRAYSRAANGCYYVEAILLNGQTNNGTPCTIPLWTMRTVDRCNIQILLVDLVLPQKANSVWRLPENTNEIQRAAQVAVENATYLDRYKFLVEILSNCKLPLPIVAMASINQANTLLNKRKRKRKQKSRRPLTKRQKGTTDPLSEAAAAAAATVESAAEQSESEGEDNELNADIPLTSNLYDITNFIRMIPLFYDLYEAHNQLVEHRLKRESAWNGFVYRPIVSRSSSGCGGRAFTYSRCLGYTNCDWIQVLQQKISRFLVDRSTRTIVGGIDEYCTPFGGRLIERSLNEIVAASAATLPAVAVTATNLVLQSSHAATFSTNALLLIEDFAALTTKKTTRTAALARLDKVFLATVNGAGEFHKLYTIRLTEENICDDDDDADEKNCGENETTELVNSGDGGASAREESLSVSVESPPRLRPPQQRQQLAASPYDTVRSLLFDSKPRTLSDRHLFTWIRNEIIQREIDTCNMPRLYVPERAWSSTSATTKSAAAAMANVSSGVARKNNKTPQHPEKGRFYKWTVVRVRHQKWLATEKTIGDIVQLETLPGKQNFIHLIKI